MIDPDTQQLRMDAERLQRAGEHARAVTLARELVTKQPGDGDAHLLLAEALLGSLQLEEAYTHAERGAEIKDDAESHFFAGSVAEQVRRWDRAESHFAAASTLDPGQAKFPLHRAIALTELERHEEALSEGQRVVRIDPTLMEGYLAIARVQDEMGKTGEAMVTLDRGLGAVAGDPSRGTALVIYKAKLLRRAGKPGDALGLIRSLTPKNQQTEAATWEMAECHRALGDPKRAATVWVVLFADEPLNARAAAEAGIAFTEAGMRNDALEYYGYAAAIDPNHTRVVVLRRMLDLPSP